MSVVSLSLPTVDTRKVYTVDEYEVKINSINVQKVYGNYYCEPLDVVEVSCQLLYGDQPATDLSLDGTLKMAVVRHANGIPTTEEVYFNFTLISGILTATGKIPWSGDWKILIDRNNTALSRIGAHFKVVADNITFLA